MKRRALFTGLTGAALLSLPAVLVPMAWAQDGQGGLTATLGVSQGLEWSDNPDFVAGDESSEVTAVTGLNFGLTSQTRTQSFSFGAGARLEVGGTETGDDVEIATSNLRFGYTRSAANSSLSASGSYRESDVGEFVPDEDLLSEDLIFDTGTRKDTSFKFGFETGLQAPIGASLNYSLRDRAFSDITDPDLFDTEQRTLSGRINFRIDPRITLRLTASEGRYEAEDVDQTERDTSSYGVGAAFDVTPSLSADVELSFDETETRDTAGTRISDGYGLSLGLTQTLQNGTLTGNLSSKVNSNGRRDTLRVGRNMDLPNGSLSFSLGVTEGETSSTRLLASVDYTRNLPRGDLKIGLSQTPNVSSTDNDVINTRLSIGYGETINSVSSWDAKLSLADISVLTEDNEDRQRADLSLSYRRALGQDWDLVSRYAYSETRGDSRPERKSNTISLSVERTFSFRP